MSHFVVSFAIVALLLAGCASTRGTQPHDMSAAEHRQAASEEEREADFHEGGSRPNPDQVTSCGSATAAEGTGNWDICWSTTTAAAQEHEREAARHREAASEHRAAAAALERAEATACQRISPDDRDMSPFAHRQDIQSVRQLQKTVHDEHGGYELMTVGTEVVFRAVPGLTAEWLQRVVDCHLARNAALGHDVPEMEYCPLVPKGVSATVTSAGDGFAVEIRSDDPSVRQEILRRAQALVD